MGAEGSKMERKYANLEESHVKFIKSKFHNVKHMDRSIFENVFPLNVLTASLAEYLTFEKKIYLENVLQVANDLKGDADTMAQALLKIHGNVEQAVTAIALAFVFVNCERKSEGERILTEYLLQDAPKSPTAFNKWLISSPIAIPTIQFVYGPLWGGEQNAFIIPKLLGTSQLLTPSLLLVINGHLPMERRRQWALLFSSAAHGSSFSQLQKRVSGEGACVIVIRTKSNQVIGCFASDGFLAGPQYRGDATCFLFQVKPELHIYSGLNGPFAYLNVQQETLPNGIGMGGQNKHWPFFLHEEYGTGISTANMTSFEKCHLAGEDAFEIDEVEVWRVGEKRKLTLDEESHMRSGKSILDKDPQAQALLEMSGRKMHSEAYREPHPMLDVEEE